MNPNINKRFTIKRKVYTVTNKPMWKNNQSYEHWLTDWLNLYYTRIEVKAQMPVEQPVLATVEASMKQSIKPWKYRHTFIIRKLHNYYILFLSHLRSCVLKLMSERQRETERGRERALVFNVNVFYRIIKISNSSSSSSPLWVFLQINFFFYFLSSHGPKLFSQRHSSLQHLHIVLPLLHHHRSRCRRSRRSDLQFHLGYEA